MNVSPAILAADRGQLFADWGIPASLEQVIEVYDPASGLRAEEVLSTTLTVVQGGINNTLSTATASTLADSNITFLVLSSELPQGISWNNCRLTTLGRAFQIITTTTSTDSGLVQLSCRQQHPEV